MIDVFVNGIGVAGPGLDNWPHASEILSGRKTYEYRKSHFEFPSLLPQNERRRCNQISCAVINVAQEALDMEGVPYHSIATVYSSSEGSSDAIDFICKSIANDDFPLSPTQFQNSVFNAIPGYWSIAARSTEPSNAVCGYDASFAVGFLEAAVQVVTENHRVLLISADQRLPEPLHSKRPISDNFACALLLGPEPGEIGTPIQIDFDQENRTPTPVEIEPLEELRQNIPAARSLPILEAIASRREKTVVIQSSSCAHLRVNVGGG